MIGVTLGSNLGYFLDRTRTSVRFWGNGVGGVLMFWRRDAFMRYPEHGRTVSEKKQQWIQVSEMICCAPGLMTVNS